MEKLYSLRQYSSSLTWLFSVCLALLFAQISLKLFSSSSGHIFLTGLLLALAVDQGMEFLPQWTNQFKKYRAINLLKATSFMVLAMPAFALILKGGFLFTAITGLLTFAFTELFDFLKPYLGELADRQLNPARKITLPPIATIEKKDPLQERLKSHFEGKTLLILGAGKHEATLQLAAYKPSHMILIDDNVERLDFIFKKIQKAHPEVKLTPHIKIPEHRVQIQHIFEGIRPDVILQGAFENNGPILNHNPSYATRVNIIDTIDWIDASRKNGVAEFALLLPVGPESSTAEKCFSIVHRYCRGLQGDAPDHPTRLLILEEDEGEATLAQYIHALSNQKEVEPPPNFPTFQRALHQLEWAVSDFNNDEVRSLLNALTQTPDVEDVLVA